MSHDRHSMVALLRSYARDLFTQAESLRKLADRIEEDGLTVLPSDNRSFWSELHEECTMRVVHVVREILPPVTSWNDLANRGEMVLMSRRCFSIVSLAKVKRALERRDLHLLP